MKIYYINTCGTCRNVLKELETLISNFELHNLKLQPITETELNTLKSIAGSYEALLNKRCSLYKERGLAKQKLSELECKNLILEHYTFLKRPLVLINNNIIMGNAADVVKKTKDYFIKLKE